MLSSRTVRDNIRYGRPSATQQEVERAAQAQALILALLQGYDTAIEQRGANLSGGQRQRIAIARGLLLEPRSLIQNDATSAVDAGTETALQAALFANRARGTTLLVAQRIAGARRGSQPGARAR